MSGFENIEEQVFRDVVALLENFPSNGKPSSSDALFFAHSAGFVERREQKKPCPTCGTERHDYSYFKVTPVGRLFVAAVRGTLFTQPLPEPPARIEDGSRGNG